MLDIEQYPILSLLVVVLYNLFVFSMQSGMGSRAETFL